MSTAGARRVASTACAAVVLALASGATAQAAPPQCTAPGPQTTVVDLDLELHAWDYCSDPDQDFLIFAISAQPTHGTMTVFDAFLIYHPEPGYTGPDAYEFTAWDGTNITAPVTVAITVVPNQPPTCPPEVAFEVEPDGSSLHPEDECDDDGLIVDFQVTDAPDHGTLDPFDDFFGLFYEPDAGYMGPDFFTVIAEDHGGLTSGPMDVVLTVLAPNRAPTCVTPVTISVPVGGRVTLDHRRTCSDPDGDPIFAGLVTGPSHGRIDLGAGTVDFVAEPGYSGADRIVYRVSDDRGGESNVAVLDLLIGNPLPPALRPDLTAPTLDLSRVAGQRLSTVRRRGLKLLLRSDEGGSATIALSVTRRTARRLRIDRKAKGPVIVGQTTKSLVAGDNEISVKLTRRAQRRLAVAKRVALLVVVTGRDIAGNAARDTLQVALRR